MEPATWTTCRDDFAFDGSLIDLLVPGTGSDAWEQFWSALRGGPFELDFLWEGLEVPLPESAAWLLAQRHETSLWVSVVVGKVTANCHFFGADLELDIHPGEVRSESDFASVLELMRFIAAAVGLPVLAASEGGGAERVFLRVSPGGQAEFQPAGSVHRF